MDNIYKSRYYGVTLVEVVVVLAILAIGILGVAIAIPQAALKAGKTVGTTYSTCYTESQFSTVRAANRHTPRLNVRHPIHKGLSAQPIVLYKEVDGTSKIVVCIPLIDGGYITYVTYTRRVF